MLGQAMDLYTMVWTVGLGLALQLHIGDQLLPLGAKDLGQGAQPSTSMEQGIKANHKWQSSDKYVCAMVMPLKKDIFGNWIEKWIYGDYRPINRKTKANWNPMPIPKRLFDIVRFSWVFSTLDLRSGYHPLPLFAEDWLKTTFWRVDHDGKDQVYYWKFLPFGLKNVHAKF